jgi:hypothetical protein
MLYRALATPRGGLFFFLCAALSIVCLGLLTLPVAAQEGPLPGTPAQGTNPDSPSSPPDVVTIAAEGCAVSEGASITLEDPDGTQAQFVDGQLGIEISSTGGQISLVGPNDDYIGDHAVSSSDPGFDTAGDYAVVTTTGIACEGGNPSQGSPEASASPIASTPPSTPPSNPPVTTPSSPPARSAPATTPASSPASEPAGPPARESGNAPTEASPLQGDNAPGPDSECPGARVVDRTRGNGDKQTPVFSVSGESFRVTTSLDTNSSRSFLFSADVNRQGGRYVTSVDRESPGTDSSIVNAGPGRFFLDITSLFTKYLVTVEDCVGAPTEGRPVPPEKRPGPIDRPEGVIRDTPVRRMPPTGGPPIVLGALALLGTAVIVGRGVLRR